MMALIYKMSELCMYDYSEQSNLPVFRRFFAQAVSEMFREKYLILQLVYP